MAAILYISYDGLCEPLGQSQVYQYLVQLAGQYHYRFQLITFEKPKDLQDREKISRLKAELAGRGITWYPLRYHKKFSVAATAYDIFRGMFVATYVLIRHNIKAVHVRSYVPATIALMLRKLFGKPFIFDMRGFWIDEKVDVGRWPRGGFLYRVGKCFEKWFLLNANSVISLTDAGIAEMREFSYLKDAKNFTKISTCVNLELFKPDKSPKRSFVVGYVGGASLWYDFDLAIKYFLEFKRQTSQAQFLIINTFEQTFILKRLAHFQIAETDYRLLSAEHHEMPTYMNEMNIAVFFIRPFYSKIASAPTKLGELLGCGVPCVTGAGIGDMAGILREENVGVVDQDQSEDSIKEKVSEAITLLADPHLRDRCVAAAEKHFSLSRALWQYDRIYSKEV